MARHIRLHIDALVLHGFAPGDRHCIADALQSRLSELLADENGLDEDVTSRTIPHADAGAIQVRNTATGVVGEQLAIALHGGLGRWLAR